MPNGIPLDELARKQLKQGREALGLTQEQFAALIGISRETLTRYERGQRDPSEDNLNAICKALGLEWKAGNVVIYQRSNRSK